MAYWGVLWWSFDPAENSGQFGDAFGALNTIFSGLAFAGLLIALYLQRQDLRLQSEELVETRKVFNKQSETMQKQTFENTFFQLLNLHNEIVNTMTSAADKLTGREYIHHLYDKVLRGGHGTANQDMNGRDAIVIIKTAYNAFHDSYYTSVGHYFRNLYNIIKFVKNSDIDDKHLYTNLIRAQLSSSEMGLLFYSCLWYESPKFKQMIEEYSLFEGLPVDILFNRDDEVNLYAASAYGKQEKEVIPPYTPQHI